MKRTPFYTQHQHMGAKIVPFGGYEMPVQYTSIIAEHKKVRSSVGVFDVSHMGEFLVKGTNALAFLQKITVNDVAKLVPGRAQYSAMCYDDGGIVDDLLVYKLGENHFMVVVNASNIDKDFQWMNNHLLPDVELRNESDATALLAIQGPKAERTLQKLTPVNLASIEYYHFAKGTCAGVEMIISRTGYTGEPGFEIYFSSEHAEKIWTAVFDAGKEFEIAPIGLGARDTLRLEMGYCLYGNDIDQTTNTLEAGLGWITKLSKGEFISKPVLEKVKAEGVKRKLVGMALPGKTVARHGYAVQANGNKVGAVTSGTFSPSLEQGIAMGYVAAEHAVTGNTVAIDIRGSLTEAKIVAFPFLHK